MTIGERIYYCRTENHMTQKELGEKTGIDSATIGKYERGVLTPKLETVQKIAAALNVPWIDLYPEEQRENIAWDATRSGKVEPYQPKYETISPNRALQMGLISLPVEWSSRERAAYYFGLLNECGQNVAIETAKSRVEELKKGNAAEFAFYMDSMDDKSLYLMAQTLEELVNLQAYQKPIEGPAKK